jgi:hypothetical protein
LAYFRSEELAHRAARLMIQYGFEDLTVGIILPVPGRTVYSSPASSLPATIRGFNSPPEHNHQTPELHADVSKQTNEPVQWDGYTHMLAVKVDSSRAATVSALLKDLGACL